MGRDILRSFEISNTAKDELQTIAATRTRLDRKDVTWADLVREAIRSELAHSSSRVSGVVRLASKRSQQGANTMSMQIRTVYLDKRLDAQVIARMNVEKCSRSRFIYSAILNFLSSQKQEAAQYHPEPHHNID